MRRASDGGFIYIIMRRYYKLSRKLAKAVTPFSLRRYEKQKGKLNTMHGGILLFVRDLNPTRMLSKFRD